MKIISADLHDTTVSEASLKLRSQTSEFNINRNVNHLRTSPLQLEIKQTISVYSSGDFECINIFQDIFWNRFIPCLLTSYIRCLVPNRCHDCHCIGRAKGTGLIDITRLINIYLYVSHTVYCFAA